MKLWDEDRHLPDARARDHPMVLAVAIIGIITILLVLGYLTLRSGQKFATGYATKQTKVP